MGSTRIKGTGVMLKLGTPSPSPVDYWADLIECYIEPEDKEANLVTFEDASQGKLHDYLMKGKAIQSTESAAFWQYVWANVGQTVPYTYAPHGNAAPTPGQPHFTGQLTITTPPKIGGQAGVDEEFEFDFEFKCTAKPTLVTSEDD